MKVRSRTGGEIKSSKQAKERKMKLRNAQNARKRTHRVDTPGTHKLQKSKRGTVVYRDETQGNNRFSAAKSALHKTKLCVCNVMRLASPRHPTPPPPHLTPWSGRGDGLEIWGYGLLWVAFESLRFMQSQVHGYQKGIDSFWVSGSVQRAATLTQKPAMLQQGTG